MSSGAVARVLYLVCSVKVRITINASVASDQGSITTCKGECAVRLCLVDPCECNTAEE